MIWHLECLCEYQSSNLVVSLRNFYLCWCQFSLFYLYVSLNNVTFLYVSHNTFTSMYLKKIMISSFLEFIPNTFYLSGIQTQDVCLQPIMLFGYPNTCCHHVSCHVVSLLWCLSWCCHLNYMVVIMLSSYLDLNLHDVKLSGCHHDQFILSVSQD